ncbi:MAG: hypothetical protein H6860_06505 [Rhodospirillales bacterium]|nr:hypothetical protein [Alphaproteobacteria bacterium]MCB9982031.1 hypothetical protein [Rhodospirillales bacterium]
MFFEKKLFWLGLGLLAVIGAGGITIFFMEALKPFIPNYIQGIGSFSGTFLGVVAGVVVTYAVQNIKEIRDSKQRVKNFVLELELNEEKIKDWLDQITNYRNSVNGDCLDTFHDYFKLSSFLYAAADKLYLTGELYSLLSNEQMKQIQPIYSEMSVGWEQALNNDITNKKNVFIELKNNDDMDTWHTHVKPEIINHVNFLEEKFKGHLNIIKAVKASLADSLK